MRSKVKTTHVFVCLKSKEMSRGKTNKSSHNFQVRASVSRVFNVRMHRFRAHLIFAHTMARENNIGNSYTTSLADLANFTKSLLKVKASFH